MRYLIEYKGIEGAGINPKPYPFTVFENALPTSRDEVIKEILNHCDDSQFVTEIRVTEIDGDKARDVTEEILDEMISEWDFTNYRWPTIFYQSKRDPEQLEAQAEIEALDAARHEDAERSKIQGGKA